MQVRRIVCALAVAVMAFALPGCSTSQRVGAPATTVSNPVFEAAPQPAGGYQSTSTDSLSAMAVIDGLQGGSLSYGAFRIDVPPGAYLGKATITVAQPDPTVLKCDISITPSTLNHFLVPVTLSAKVPSTTALSIDQMMWFDPSTSLWQILPTLSDANALELHSQLWHFSQYGCGRAGW